MKVGLARAKRVIAVSLLPPHPGDDAETMDKVAHELEKGDGSTDVVLWRVSSVDDLSRRLWHIEDGTLESLDIVGHAKEGWLGVGSMNPSESAISSDQASFEPLAFLRSKFRSVDTACVRLVGCYVGNYHPGNKHVARSRSGPALLLALSHFLGVTVKGSISGVVPVGNGHEGTLKIINDIDMIAAKHHVPSMEFPDRTSFHRVPLEQEPALEAELEQLRELVQRTVEVQLQNEDLPWRHWHEFRANLDWAKAEAGQVLAAGRTLGGPELDARLILDGRALAVRRDDDSWFIPIKRQLEKHTGEAT